MIAESTAMSMLQKQAHNERETADDTLQANYVLTGSVTTCPLKPRTSSINPPNPQKNPNTPPNFRPCPAPISANSDTSPANSDGPLANFGACPAATDTYPGPPKPREPPPLFPIFATHHQLNTLVPPTYSGVSRQPRGNPHSPMIPSTYQRGTILDHNRHPPTPSSPAKPRCHSRRTPKSSGISRSYLSLPVLSQSPGLVSSPFRYCSRYRFVSLFESTLVPYQHHPISSDAVSVTPSDHCAQVFINLNDLTNSAITITNPDTPLPGPNLALRLVPDSISSK
ncbi:GTP-binding protein TypA/BipA like protein [Termitomyces sp. T112]|nr:GTP-binding protein TypA/BipA like protein [Termitomyces sp. T112]